MPDKDELIAVLLKALLGCEGGLVMLSGLTKGDRAAQALAGLNEAVERAAIAGYLPA